MNKIFYDERSLNKKRMIESEICRILTVLLAVSILIKFYFLNQGVESIMTEAISLGVIGVYYVVRSLILGHTFHTKKFDLKTLLLVATIGSFLCWFLAGYKTLTMLIFIFLIQVGIVGGLNGVIFLLNKVKQDKMESELED